MRLLDLYDKNVLVTRESAHTVVDVVPASDLDSGHLSLDFSGVQAVTPSFFDELLGVIEDKLSDRHKFKITLVNFPTRLSSKFAAIARGRRVRIDESHAGQWEISRGEE